MRILLANPRGFCAGVDRAIAIVERALDLFGRPIHVRHEVVHNRTVVEGLKQRGAVFVDELADVPDGATVIFSAHGVSQAVRSEAARRGLRVFDATCPLVTKVHLEVARHARAGHDLILIGHAGHPEVEGTLGQWPADAAGEIHLVEKLDHARTVTVRQPERLHYTTQTTLSVDETREIVAALQRRFPSIQAPRIDDICYATQNRQDAVRTLAGRCQLLLVVGSPNSSNSNRLRELAENIGVRAYLIDGPDDIDPAWLAGVASVGVTAGASAPESLVQAVVARLRMHGGGEPEQVSGVEERMVFALPRELRVRVVA